MYSQRKTPYQKKSKKKSHHYQWLTVICLVIIFGFALYFIKTTQTQSIQAQVQPTKPMHPKPLFEFYDILQRETQEIRPVPTKPSKPVQPIPEAKYVIQIASFQNYTDADKLKANLLLLDFKATIHSAVINQKTWYRLYLGPFDSKKSAETQLIRVKENQLTGFLRRAD